MQSKPECYDVFNDYLGLSNVVGQQAEFTWIDSLLGSAAPPQNDTWQTELYDLHEENSLDPSLRVPNDSSTSDSPRDRESSFQKKQPLAENASTNYAGVTLLSDVERLFGRGAQIERKPGPAQHTTVSASPPACPSTHDQSQQRDFGTGKPPRTGYGSNGMQTEMELCASLHAILMKYNRHRNVSGLNTAPAVNTEPKQTEGAGGWIKMDTLTTALAQIAASYEEQKAMSPQQPPTTMSNENPTAQPRRPVSLPNQTRFVGCSFCKNNREVEEWFLSHQLKDTMGRVTCPVLRSYVCPLCCATGDDAHTIGHCPMNRDRRSSLPLAIRSKANAVGKKKFL